MENNLAMLREHIEELELVINKSIDLHNLRAKEIKKLHLENSKLKANYKILFDKIDLCFKEIALIKKEYVTN